MRKFFNRVFFPRIFVGPIVPVVPDSRTYLNYHSSEISPIGEIVLPPG